MLSNLSTLNVIISNIFLMLCWNMIILLFSKNLNRSVFDPKRKIYKQKPWEMDGKFYTRFLHIKKWKDHLPQHVGKSGFSKKQLVKTSEISVEYIYEFIIETCRAEWNHIMCCLFLVVSFIINSHFYALVFSFISVLTNLPFIFIQRYNRIRLTKLIKYKFGKSNRRNTSHSLTAMDL